MFTGIVETTAPVKKRLPDGLVIERPLIFDDLTIGASISVAGACLTVTAFDNETMSFNVVDETWACTNLGTISDGKHVNLERAMKTGDRFEGHMVQGHVEALGEVVEATSADEAWLTITLPDQLLPAIIPKGSITFDGVSLTVAKLEGNNVSVALIPHTLENTTLGNLQIGDAVNTETDMIGRYVAHLLPT